jgi:hypothetical protein
MQGNTIKGAEVAGSTIFRTFTIEMFLYSAMQKLIEPGRANRLAEKNFGKRGARYLGVLSKLPLCSVAFA